MFNIINTRTLNYWCTKYPEASGSLRKWYFDLKRASFSTANELKSAYGNASIIADNRVVFNISGNHYRLVVRINYQYKAIQLKWFGTHAEYDRIDVTTVQP
ncbi:type II toxin-antitoxin system HigB family toxin [Larkinella punicea]|uniref:Type II toxin-antitoxin system HigB family toxin n=1 Tax=Larkinella punicea TaxID=2315727 RepID=A0A368JXV3_9BACT|nr:type II toxin-antitoxin system HigB family toxin [Larkinella punicea]RCR71051.1 type II toxin-antitoxin system HigB family toxin [Larkinella punicea]